MMQPASSLTERVQTLAFDAHILAAGFVGGQLAVVTAEGAIQLGRETPALHPHADAILVARIAADRIVTAGMMAASLNSVPEKSQSSSARQRLGGCPRAGP